MDRNGRYRFANKAYEDWYGQSPAEIVGRDVRSVLGEDAFALRRPYIKSALAGEECSLDVEITRADGRVRYGEARYLPHRRRNRRCGRVSTPMSSTSRNARRQRTPCSG